MKVLTGYSKGPLLHSLTSSGGPIVIDFLSGTQAPIRLKLRDRCSNFLLIYHERLVWTKKKDLEERKTLRQSAIACKVKTPESQLRSLLCSPEICDIDQLLCLHCWSPESSLLNKQNNLKAASSDHLFRKFLFVFGISFKIPHWIWIHTRFFRESVPYANSLVSFICSALKLHHIQDPQNG